MSLLVSDLSRKGVLERRADPADRRRRIVDITASRRPAIEMWLSPTARAWRHALTPLTPPERDRLVATLLAFEAALDDAAAEERATKAGQRRDQRLTS